LRFSKPKTRRYEDQSEPFPYFFGELSLARYRRLRI
jgi:hypothetical protein